MTHDLKDQMAIIAQKPFVKAYNTFVMPEYNFVKVNMSGFGTGIMFWIANAYSKDSLNKNEKTSFLTGFTNSTAISNQTVDISWGEAIDPVKYFNIIKPFAVLITTLKHAAGDAIDRDKISVSGRSSTSAKIGKIAISALILPLELPIKIADKFVDLTLKPISMIIEKIQENNKQILNTELEQDEENLNLIHKEPELRKFVSHKNSPYKRKFDHIEDSNPKPRKWIEHKKARYVSNLSGEELNDSTPQASESNLRPWAKFLLDSDENDLSRYANNVRISRIHSNSTVRGA